VSDNVDISIVRSAIENSALFSDLPNSMLNELAAACKTKRFNKDDFIWSVGQPTAHLFNVLSGRTDRKFNRMRPSMAPVLGFEPRSAKAG
jgi:signal-transduction protein with cAMP-binding, CBS, and nucleotidyltransferase domain